MPDLDEYLSGPATLADLVVDPPEELIQRVCRDADDDYLVALAFEAGVDLVVSPDFAARFDVGHDS